MKNSLSLSQGDYSFLRQDDFKAKYSLGRDGSRMRFYIGGLRCGKCVRKIEDLAVNTPGVKQIRVEMGKSIASVELDPQTLSFAELAQKISDLGFDPIPLTPDSKSEEEQNKEDRNELIRLAVAGACAANIMTFSFATYFGDTGALYSLFAWLSFSLYLPVVSYVAWPFYVGAWKSLRLKQLSIDLPMAIASLSGFVFSTIELFRGKEDIYFDSLSGFLFLILISRWTQKRLQRKFLKADAMAESFRLEKVRVLSSLNSTEWIWKPLEHLRLNETILLCRGETLPVDAELISTAGDFGMAWLSGESASKTFLQGSLVPAGARLFSTEIKVQVKNLFNDTRFGKILAEVQKFSLSKNRVITQADEWAQWLLAIVFSVAGIFLVSYWFISPEEAIHRSLALIVLACPCAMAFGTPLALASALKTAQKKGLIVRNANVFEKATQVRNLFFDKTGTLTDTQLTLVERPGDISPIYQKIILSLENSSHHPIAFAFRKSFETPENLLPVEQFREIPGRGVTGYIYGRLYEIRKGDIENDSSISCSLYEENNKILQVHFQTEIKSDSLEVLRELRRENYRLFLVSGDHKNAVLDLSKKLEFSTAETFFEMSPEDKLNLITQHSHSLMMGDGVNDSLALMRAHVSVAASGGVEAALQSSDVYLTEPSLKGLKDLLEISHSALGLIRQNLMISVAYNVIGAVLALMGFINPMVAALLMPVSSGFILLSTWLRSRQ